MVSSRLLFEKSLPFIRRLNSCIDVWQRPISVLVSLQSLSRLPISCPWLTKNGFFCPYARDSSYIASDILSGVSFLTMTAISVDRLLALFLGLRYRPVETLKRAYLFVANVWVIPTVVAKLYPRNHLLTIWDGKIVIPSCLVISILSYSKIFHILQHRQTQVQDHVQLQQSSQAIPLNIERYKKAVSSALWVQLTLAVCYLSFGVMAALLSNKDYLLQFFCMGIKSDFALLKLFVKFVSLLLEHSWCKTSSEGSNQRSTLLFVLLGHCQIPWKM